MCVNVLFYVVVRYYLEVGPLQLRCEADCYCMLLTVAIWFAVVVIGVS